MSSGSSNLRQERSGGCHGDTGRGQHLAEVKEKVRGSSSQKSASSLCWKVPGGGSISASRARISSFTKESDLLGVIITITITIIIIIIIIMITDLLEEFLTAVTICSSSSKSRYAQRHKITLWKN